MPSSQRTLFSLQRYLILICVTPGFLSNVTWNILANKWHVSADIIGNNKIVVILHKKLNGTWLVSRFYIKKFANINILERNIPIIKLKIEKKFTKMFEKLLLHSILQLASFEINLSALDAIFPELKPVDTEIKRMRPLRTLVTLTTAIYRELWTIVRARCAQTEQRVRLYIWEDRSMEVHD